MLPPMTKRKSNPTLLSANSQEENDELYLLLKPIYTQATNGKMKNAILEWIKNRRELPKINRTNSIWTLSVFDSFHDLGIPDTFNTYDNFVSKYKKACQQIKPRMNDRVWSEPALAIQKCFNHPRKSNVRLSKIGSKLRKTRKSRPNTPVPSPPSKKDKE